MGAQKGGEGGCVGSRVQHVCCAIITPFTSQGPTCGRRENTGPLHSPEDSAPSGTESLRLLLARVRVQDR